VSEIAGDDGVRKAVRPLDDLRDQGRARLLAPPQVHHQAAKPLLVFG
jgi:hypothetical protein